MSPKVRRSCFLLIGLVWIAGWFGCSPTRPSCVYALSPTSLAVSPLGDSGTVSVSTGGTCTWSASSSAGWLTIVSGANGTGRGTITFSAAANGSVARSATLTVAGQSATVSQDAAPAPRYTLSGRIIDAFLASPDAPHATWPGIAGVSVVVSDGPTPGSATTDGSGDFTVAGLLAGTYAVTAAKAMYATATSTVTVAGPTAVWVTMALDPPVPHVVSNVTGYWSGAGTYPNDPFKLVLIQTGNQLRGMYADQHDASPAVSGTYSTPEFTLRVDFGDAVLFLECMIEDAHDVSGVQRTSALGNRPYAFRMKR